MIEEKAKNLEDRYAFRNIGCGHHPIVHLDPNPTCRTPVPSPQPLGYSAEVGVLDNTISDRFPGHVRVVGDRGKVIVANIAVEETRYIRIVGAQRRFELVWRG